MRRRVSTQRHRAILPTSIVHHVASFLNVADGDCARWSCVDRNTRNDLQTYRVTALCIKQDTRLPSASAVAKWLQRLQRVDISTASWHWWTWLDPAQCIRSLRMTCYELVDASSFLERHSGLTELLARTWPTEFLLPRQLSGHWSSLRRLQCPLTLLPPDVLAPCLEEAELILLQRYTFAAIQTLAKQPRLRHLDVSFNYGELTQVAACASLLAHLDYVAIDQDAGHSVVIDHANAGLQYEGAFITNPHCESLLHLVHGNVGEAQATLYNSVLFAGRFRRVSLRIHTLHVSTHDALRSKWDVDTSANITMELSDHVTDFDMLPASYCQHVHTLLNRSWQNVSANRHQLLYAKRRFANLQCVKLHVMDHEWGSQPGIERELLPIRFALHKEDMLVRLHSLSERPPCRV